VNSNNSINEACEIVFTKGCEASIEWVYQFDEHKERGEIVVI
jgi:hypothetical protein